MKENFFSGVCTALVTPFQGNAIDEDALVRLMEFQISQGIQTLVLGGTTGEAPTLSDREKEELFRLGKEVCQGRCRIIAGTGSNDTHHALELSRMAQEVGMDGLLVVTPYYNKATPAGLVHHYGLLNGAVRVPIIAYNVPSRTGVDMSIEVYRELAAMEHLLGVKEAGGSISKIADIVAQCPTDFYLWSGNDDQALPVLSLGGCGVISVLSNIAPREMIDLVTLAQDGNYPDAARKQRRLLPLMRLLFCQVNPIPVKAAAALLGFGDGTCRLPLTTLGQEEREALRREMGRLSLLAP